MAAVAGLEVEGILISVCDICFRVYFIDTKLDDTFSSSPELSHAPFKVDQKNGIF